MEVIIPTRNDYLHLDNICKKLSKLREINIIHVVDNGSKPKNAQIIRDICRLQSKCRYHSCQIPGKGNAIRTALAHVTQDVLFIDADIENLDINKIEKLISKLDTGYDLVKANITRTNGQSNSIFISKEINSLYPEINISRPTCGIYCVRKDFLNNIKIPNDWSVDLSILIQVYKNNGKITELNIGEIVDKPRSTKSLQESKECLLKELKFIGGIKNDNIYPQS